MTVNREALAPAAYPGDSARALLIARGLTKDFALKRGFFGRGRGVIRAVDGVSFVLAEGETLGIVGESGCGKSTLSRLIMGLVAPNEGEVIFNGQSVGPGGLSRKEYRRQVQIVFQDSYASLNPRLSIEETIAFGPSVHGMARKAALGRAHELLEMVGLRPTEFARRYPHELSGGQRQRVNIARALALRPRLVILDEPVSALDKSVEAQVLNLLKDFKVAFGLTYLFISHDLNVVQYMSDRVLVMYLGGISEIGSAEAIYARPAHPYTAALLASRPTSDPTRRRAEPPLVGDPPSPIDAIAGCRFHSRCPMAEPICERTAPALVPVAADHWTACLMACAGSGHSLAPSVVVAQQ